jgi:AcrR family transcriptional regulator
LFCQGGYDGTTLRAVAKEADCDPALIVYYFGSKRALFAHVMTLALSPTSVLEQALEGDPESVGPRLLDHVIRAWEDPEVARTLGRLVQAAMGDEELMRTFREYVDREILGRLVEYLGGGRDAAARANALLTLVIGCIFARYVLRVPAIASQDSDRMLVVLAPAARAASASRRRLR